MEIFSIKNLSFKYPDSDKKALTDINLTFNSGEFVTVCGKSGSSKTTLLKLLKPEISPKGEKTGEIVYKGINLYADKTLENTNEIGFVMQNPENQLVCDTVIKELAFGLENMCLSPSEIKSRIAEVSAFFGIDDMMDKSTNELSGGQKQLISLASIIAMNPKVIILDEPASQLDPIATDTFFSLLEKINKHLGITIIISEHNLEASFSMSDRVVFLDDGKITCNNTPEIVSREMLKTDMKIALPSVTRIFADEDVKILPLNVKEGRNIIMSQYQKSTCPFVLNEILGDEIIKLKDVWFRYTNNGKDVLKGVDLTVKKGEILAIIGSNGSGKTTLLSVIAKLIKAYKGSVKIDNKAISEYKGNQLYKEKLGLLHQNPITLFSSDSIRKDYMESCRVLGKNEEVIDKIANNLFISNLLDRHPYDLSGGEIQKCALGRILISDAEIILLDEPTKGFDALYKSEIGLLLNKLSKEGKTIVIVTHDVEFAAEYCHTCAMLFDGQIVRIDSPQKFFADNYFYTTASRIIAKDVVENAVTVSQVTKNLKKI